MNTNKHKQYTSASDIGLLLESMHTKH